MYQLQLSSKIALLGGRRGVTHVTPNRKMDVFHFRRRRVRQLLSLLGVARPCCFFMTFFNNMTFTEVGFKLNLIFHLRSQKTSG